MFKTDDKPRGLTDEPMHKAMPSIPTGWKCPQCQRINAPAVKVCECSSPFQISVR
jgi:hypothetical protein